MTGSGSKGTNDSTSLHRARNMTLHPFSDAQGKDKAYFEMSNFDWTQHAKGLRV